MSTHAKLSPSAAKRWMACPGSVRLIEKLGSPDKSGKYASEGTVAHKICELCLLEGKEPKEFLNKTMEADGFKFKVNQEMVDACDVYVNYIREALSMYEPYWFKKSDVNINDSTIECRIEHRCSLESLKVPGMTGGTSDCVLIDWDRLTIEIVDYKHGAGVSVEAEHNPQPMQYGVGVLLELQKKGVDLEGWQVFLTIIQPRAFHGKGPIRTWSVSADWLLRWAHEELVPAGWATHELNAPLNPTHEGCLFCPVNPCAARNKMTSEIAMIDFENCDNEDAVLPDPEFMTTEQKIKVLDHADFIKTFLKAVERQVFNEIDAGSKDYKGKYKQVRSSKQRQVEESAYDEITSPLLEYVEYDSLFIRKKKSVGELESTLKDHFRASGIKRFAKKAKEILEQVTFKPVGEIVLAPESDKRAEVLPSIIGEFKMLEDKTETNEEDDL